MAFTTRLFVGNIPNDFDEKALRDAFSSYGDITNFDLKSKPGIDSDKKTFAFVTISASNFNIESCIKHFANEEFQGNRLHVTRARESFLERLQREREQSQKNDNKQIEHAPASSLSNTFPKIDKPSFNKRKFIDDEIDDTPIVKKNKVKYTERANDLSSNYTKDDYNKKQTISSIPFNHEDNNKKDGLFQTDEKKQNSDKKRLESMKRKRQEFSEKKNIIKSGLISIDKKPNKKVIFSDTEEDNLVKNSENSGSVKQTHNGKTSLFEDEASDEEINFEIKKQFEGAKGQKVLDLQSRYKSDKRFVLDERFVEDDSASEKEDNGEQREDIELGQADEKSKQLNILQDVLGVTIKSRYDNQYDTTNKIKTKLGMLRFDPMQPEHAKYLAPVETKPESTKKSKKKKSKDTESKEEEIITQQPEPVVEKVEVSKEQFYKISDTLKEAITQPNSFSLRSLFTKDDVAQEETPEEDQNYIPLPSKTVSKVKNPLEPGERNPFVYDSSESENEEDPNQNSDKVVEEKIETKIVWREKFFFSSDDNRLKDGLLYFCKTNENAVQKERRELKSLMKKRIYNKERKNTMFQKKIGGRKKTMKKKFKKG
ncbi:probable RNA-binding protein CG14230 [Vanessa cardui]|uniref:probable RNA-binding protein CG14230 n=1 Tax=Vanessa cardui TaxID=171605 RepID=UPI001F12D13D|nr:probable RNA-binding protein CG14230 [Vanessa cardui]